ncbi:TMV resistance protein N-like protein [Tanacetum coccineum]
MKKSKSQGGSSSSSSHSFNNKNGFQYQIENDNTNDTDATIEDPVHMTSSGYADILLIWLGRRLLCRCLDPENGADMIQERLRNKKVLIVLDGVDDFKQLEFIAKSNEWFGSGSRIIITTRNEQLLSDANSKYKPPILTKDQSLELFSKHTFWENNPPEGYKDLSTRAIRYTGRLPRGLKVLGSFFRGRQASVWETALDRLAKIPIDKGIFDTLKLSFDKLNGFEQKNVPRHCMFL